MANVFRQNADVNEHPNRNNFDLFYQNHMTLKIGTLYPFCCKPVVPGDSFRINTAIGLKFMPLAFPVQSRMRAVVHYFYVRNKNLWDDWYNFVQGLEDKTHPYIDKDASWFRTGSLADYLGLPTTVVTNAANASYGYLAVRSEEHDMVVSWLSASESQTFLPDLAISAEESSVDIGTEITDGTITYSQNGTQNTTNYTSQASDVLTQSSMVRMQYPLSLYESCHDSYMGDTSIEVTGQAWSAQYSNSYALDIVGDTRRYYATTLFKISASLSTSLIDGVRKGIMLLRNYSGVGSNNGVVNLYANSFYGTRFTGQKLAFIGTFTGLTFNNDGECTIELSEEQVNRINGFFEADMAGVTRAGNYAEVAIGITYPAYSPNNNNSTQNIYAYSIKVMNVASVETNVESSERIDADTFRNLRINALPFRAYESIYNAFYRNTQNQPFVLNGEKQFNKYNTTKASGADTTDYHLFQRNWQLDFMTSALPSPQQGVAPLVGLVKANGDVTITDDDGNVTNATLGFDSDGDTLTGKVSIHNPAASTENNITLSQAAMAAAGMSINDFRNVNALQHWLETNMRKGYKYKDFIEGHFGKSPRYEELDMPEFIGGFTQDVNVSLVTQTTPTDGHPLGSYAANANAFGQGRSITHYCDDYGYIMGIVCVVPDPAYSQLLPKHFLAHSKLDYYFPEFAQLGMQPIPMSEVAPLQVAYENPDAETAIKQMQRTFGYQRPNYDLVAAMDEVHGQFRTNLKDYLIQRIFGYHPELGNDFLQIKNDEVDNIFTYHSPDEDNIIGQIVVDIKAKRPIPRIHMPSLGR